MARKKRRRLKKSVRRGCAVALAIPLFICLFHLLKAIGNLGSASDDEPEPELVTAADSARLADMGERLARLLNNPQRIDSSTISVEVCDITTGRTVYSRNAGRLVPPASCMKLLTAVSTMQFLGIGHNYTSRVLTTGEQNGPVLCGDLIFCLDDDPLLLSLEPLVTAVSQRGIRRIEGNVVLELARDDTLRAHSTAAPWDIPYHKLPILLKGRGRIEHDLRYLLQAKGVSLAQGRILPQHSGKGLAEVEICRHETPLVDVIAPMLIHSSNIKADALFGHIARVGNRWSLVDLTASQWLKTTANAVGGNSEGFIINDGSGLSPDNRLTAHFLVRLLCYAWDNDDMHRVLLEQALATPGHPTRRGSLLWRMTAPDYRDRIFVKTGTLTTCALSSLAGYARGRDDHWYVFAIVNENTPVAEGRILQDRLCHTLIQ